MRAWWKRLLLYFVCMTKEATERPDTVVELSSRQYRAWMFGDSGRCECNNRGKCAKGDACFYKKAKAALKRAHDIRKFEIELLWKRAAYVATFQTLLFAALGLSFRAHDNDQVILFQIVTCVAGVFSSFFWRLINKGSKFWHENWTYHIDFLEDEFEGRLHKTVLYSGKTSALSRMIDCIRGKSRGRTLNEKSIRAKTQPYSVSRVNIWISNLFFVAWLLLLISFSVGIERTHNAIIDFLVGVNLVFCESTPDYLCREWFVPLFWILPLGLLYGFHKGLRSKFDDMNPKKDVRWAKRVLPKAIRKRSGEKEK